MVRHYDTALVHSWGPELSGCGSPKVEYLQCRVETSSCWSECRRPICVARAVLAYQRQPSDLQCIFVPTPQESLTPRGTNSPLAAVLVLTSSHLLLNRHHRYRLFEVPQRQKMTTHVPIEVEPAARRSSSIDDIPPPPYELRSSGSLLSTSTSITGELPEYLEPLPPCKS